MNNANSTKAAKQIASMALGEASYLILPIAVGDIASDIMVEKTIPMATRIPLIKEMAGCAFPRLGVFDGTYTPGLFEKYARVLVIEAYTDICADAENGGMTNVEILAFDRMTGLYDKIIASEDCDAKSVVDYAEELVLHRRDLERNAAPLFGIRDAAIAMLDNLNDGISKLSGIDTEKLFGMAAAFSRIDEDKLVEAVLDAKAGGEAE